MQDLQLRRGAIRYQPGLGLKANHEMRKKHWHGPGFVRRVEAPSVLQRKNAFNAASVARPSRPFTAAVGKTTKDPIRRHDFGIVPIYAQGSNSFPRINDQTPSETEAPTNDLNMGTEEAKPNTTAPVIDAVELVSSSTGAVSGYPEKEDMCDASLSKPGPFNDVAFKGSVANVHQIHFHVSSGYPGDLRASRVVNRTGEARGKTFPKSGNDGPPDHEYKYTKDKMVIADAPGWCNKMTETDFPVSYSGDFALYAWDAPTHNILASIAYHVEIKKTHFSQADPVNTVTVTDKKIGGTVPSPVKPKK